MAQIVELPNGETAEFPDEAGVEQIQSALQSSYPQFFQAPERTVAGTLGDIGISALKSTISVPEAAVGLLDIPTGGRVGRAVEDAGVRFKDAKAILDENLSPAQKAANARVEAAEGFLPTVGTMLENPSTIGHAALESAASMGAGGVVGRGLISAAPRVAGWAAGAIGEGVVGAGAAAEDIRQKSADGLLTVPQSGAALASGAITGAIGAAGGRLAQKLGFADVDTMLAQGGSKLNSAGVARRILEGGFSEGVLEEMPQSAQEQVWQNAALGRPLMEGVTKAAAQGMLVGGLMGGGVNAIANAPTVDDAIGAANAALDAAVPAIDEFKSDAMGPTGLLGAPSAGPALQVTPGGIAGTAEQLDAAAEAERLAGLAPQPADTAPAGLISSSQLPIIGEPTVTPDTSGSRTDTTGVRADDLTGAPVTVPAAEPLVAPQERVASDIESYQTAEGKAARGELLSSYERAILDAGPPSTPSRLQVVEAPAAEQRTAQRKLEREGSTPLPVTQQVLTQQETPSPMGQVPTSVGGVNEAQLSNEQLTSIIANPTTHANTRRAAQAVLGARMSQPRGEPAAGTSPAPAPEPVASSEAAGVAAIFGPGAQLRTADAAPQPGERVTQTMKRVLTQMGRLTGTKVVFVSAEGADGATRSKDGNTVYINTRSSINPMQVMGHETTHVLKRKHREAWAAIKEATGAAVDDAALAEFARNYWINNRAMREMVAKAETGGTLSTLLDSKPAGLVTSEASMRDFLLDEMISDLGGERWSDPQFWENVFGRIEQQHGGEKAKGIVQRLVAAVKELINRFMTLAKRDGFAEFRTEGELATRITPEQLQAVRTAIESAYAEFISAERRSEPAGYVRDTAAPTVFPDVTGDEDIEALEGSQQSTARATVDTDEVPDRPTADRTLDAATLADLRRKATRLERPRDGIMLRVTEQGEAIATGTVGATIPRTFRDFAKKFGLTFIARGHAPRSFGSVGRPIGDLSVSSGNRDVMSAASEPMPDEYRAGGAQYSAEMDPSVDRTDRTRFSERRTQPVDTDSKAFRRWARGARLVTMDDSHAEFFKAGEPVVVQALHGTTGDIAAFDLSKADIESDLGAGIYATNTPEDVSANYAGEGPDLTGKLEREAERQNDFLQDDEWSEGKTDAEIDTEAYRRAREKLAVQHGGMTMPVYIRFENPVVLGGNNETFLDLTEAYDEETDEYGEQTGALAGFIEGLRAAVYGFYDADVEAGIGALFENSDGEGLRAGQIIEILKASGALGYATDDNGDSATSEIIRRAFEAAGYDGFIDQTVNKKFGSEKRIGKPMAGMTQGTVHYVAFSPTQIKSAVSNTGAFSGTDPNILHSERRTQPVDTDSAEFKRWFGNSKVVDSAGKPQRMYHGTGADIKIFRSGKSDGGLFLSPEPEFANDFADTADGNVLPVYVRAEKVFDYENKQDVLKFNLAMRNQGMSSDKASLLAQDVATGNWDIIEDDPRVRAYLQDQGFDGVWVKERGVKNMMVRNATQIKSAVSNTGAFSRVDPDIQRSERRTANITAEVLPSTKVSDLDTRLTAKQKRQFHKEALDLIFTNGRNELARRAGLVLYSETGGTGGYENKINPNEITSATAKEVRQGRFDFTAVDRYALAWQYIFKQDGVPWFRADRDTDPAKAGGMSQGYYITFDRDLTAADESVMFAALKSDISDSVGYTRMSANSIAVINYRGDDGAPFMMPDADFKAAVDRFRHMADVINAEPFAAETRYHYHDFHEDPQGTGILARDEIQSEQQDFRPWLRSRREAFDALVSRWEGVQRSEQRSDAAGDRPDRASVAGEGRPNYGRSLDRHSVVVTGVHYSREQRDILSSAFFGTGLKGQERLRLLDADDARIKRRLYFYASTGGGINPEAGVGAYAHSVGLNNVYDMDVDPLRLYPQPVEGEPYRSPNQRMNAFESAVIDAGYDGYMTREFGRGGAVVLLGDHSVPVKYEGAGVRPEVPGLPAPQYSNLQQLRRRIAENRALPAGQMTGLEWKRLLMREMPEVDPRWLDNERLYRKGDLLAGATEHTGAFDPTNPDIRESTPRSQIPQMWQDQRPVDALDNLYRNLQDKHIDTKRVVASIRAAGIAIKDKFDPYLQETLYHGRAAKQVSNFTDKELLPLYVEMQARGITQSELNDYLWARHATERNAQIAKVNPNMPDGGSGLTNQQAADILAGAAVTVGSRTIQLRPTKMTSYASLGARVNAITKATTDLLVSSGLESPETVAAWRAAYGNYVPLMRDMESDDNYLGAMGLGMGTGSGFSIRGSASKRAMGSSREAVDILANIAMQRERAITRAEKNKVSKAVYGLALTATNPDFWLPVNPDANDPAKQQLVENELLAMGLSPLDAKSIAKEPVQQYTDPTTGLVTTRINPALRGRDNVLALRLNGRDRYVFFSSDERAQQMVRNLKNLDNDQMGEMMSSVAAVTRYFASINTQYNPVFGLTNGIRDLSTGMLNLSSTPLKGKQKRVLAHAWDALRGIYADLRDHRAGRTPTSVWAQEFEEFAEQGAQTGYRDMFATSDTRAKEIEKEIKRAGQGQKWLAMNPKNSIIFGWLSDYNTAIENAVRLAAYKVAKEDGMSLEQAANLAKNLTVNFNKKGLAATQTGALYAFFNAAVQGTARIGQTMLHRDDVTGKLELSKAGQKIAYGGVMLGALQAVMFSLAGWDDEEPPQFIREKNIIIPTGGGKYLSFPMPLGFHTIVNMGRIPTEFALSGFKKPGERMVNMFRVLADGFNPIGSSTLLQTVSPTVFDPLAAMAENKNWSGKSIYKEDFNKMEPTPGWTRVKDTASQPGRWLAYATNYITGGGKYGIGLASPTPDQIDYLIGQAAGGVGRESLKAWQTAKAPLSGETLPLHKIPVAGRFIGTTTGQESEVSRFYNNLKRIGEHDSTLKEIRAAKDTRAYEAYVRENPDARMIKLADKASRDLSALKRQKREALEKNQAERVRVIEMQITNRVRNYNKMLDARS